MAFLCNDDGLSIRKMRDCDEDYAILLKWLSDPAVLDYCEGRNHPFDMAQVKENFPTEREANHVLPNASLCATDTQ